MGDNLGTLKIASEEIDTGSDLKEGETGERIESSRVSQEGTSNFFFLALKYIITFHEAVGTWKVAINNSITWLLGENHQAYLIFFQAVPENIC